MNVLLRRHIGWMAVCLGIGCWILNSSMLLQAQTTPSNPLRPADVKPLEAPSRVAQASVTAPVRAAVHTEFRESQPAALGPQPVVHRPASFSYGSRATRGEVRGFVPRHAQVASAQAMEEMIVEPLPGDDSGEMILDPSEMPGEPLAGDCCGPDDTGLRRMWPLQRLPDPMSHLRSRQHRVVCGHTGIHRTIEPR